VKVFLDTNVVVSAYAARGLCADVLRLVLAEHELMVGEVVLEELERVLGGKLRLPPAYIQEILESLREHHVQPRPQSPGDRVLRDPDDAWVLASALEAGAEVLITGDPDLLEVAADVDELRIVTPRAFWEMIRSG
jgi:uncharacterized protein